MSSIDFSSLTTSTDYSSLFNSASTSSSSSSSSSSLYTDWANLKNGTTAKLAKSYYSKSSSSSSAVTSEEAKETIKANTELKSDTQSLRSSVSALMDSKTLFTNKIETKDEDGNVTTDYDRDKIYKSLKSFVDSYNSVVQSGGDSDNTRVLRNTMHMTQMTKANENLLSEVGITIGEDNKLSIDESAVKEADINSLKSLFSGSGSYAASVDARASEIVNAVNAENNKLSQYTAAGSYVSTDTIGKLYDGTL